MFWKLFSDFPGLHSEVEMSSSSPHCGDACQLYPGVEQHFPANNWSSIVQRWLHISTQRFSRKLHNLWCLSRPGYFQSWQWPSWPYYAGRTWKQWGARDTAPILLCPAYWCLPCKYSFYWPRIKGLPPQAAWLRTCVMVWVGPTCSRKSHSAWCIAVCSNEWCKCVWFCRSCRYTKRVPSYTSICKRKIPSRPY